MLIHILYLIFNSLQPVNQNVTKKKTKLSRFNIFAKRQSLDITDPVFVLSQGYTTKQGLNLSQIGYVNERFRFDETVFASNGRLAGISTVSC